MHIVSCIFKEQTVSLSETSVLTQHAPNLWTLAHPLRLGLVEFDHVMTVVQLDDNQLWIHSPVTYSPALAQALEALGTPAFFIAPNTFHDLYWKAWFEAYPQARFYAVPGVREAHTELPFTDVLTNKPPTEWRDAFDQHLVGGVPKINEIAFFHPASNSVILTDLVFNYETDPGFNFATRCMLKMAGTYNRRCAVSRLLRLYLRDKAAVRRSIDEIADWDFERLIVGHGQPLETKGRHALRQDYAFLSH